MDPTTFKWVGAFVMLCTLPVSLLFPRAKVIKRAPLYGPLREGEERSPEDFFPKGTCSRSDWTIVLCMMLWNMIWGVAVPVGYIPWSSHLTMMVLPLVLQGAVLYLQETGTLEAFLNTAGRWLPRSWQPQLAAIVLDKEGK